MSAFLKPSVIAALVALASSVSAAIHEYVFSTTIDLAAPGSATNETVETPVRGVLVLDTASTSPSAPLGSTAFEEAMASLYLEIGGTVQIAASGPTVAATTQFASLPSGATYSLAADFGKIDTARSTPIFVGLRPGEENGLQLSGLRLAFDANTLAALEIGETARGDLALGSLQLTTVDGQTTDVDFTVSEIKRRRSRGAYSPEWDSFQAYVADRIYSTEVDDYFLQFDLFPSPGGPGNGGGNGGGDPTDPGGDDGGLTPIPEASAFPLLLGLAAAAGLLVRRRR